MAQVHNVPAKTKLTPVNRPSISVSGRTYDRLRAARPSGGLAAYVEAIVTAALNDPAIAARVVDECRRADALS